MSDPLVDQFREQLRKGTNPDLAETLEQAVLARRETRGGHADWAQLCEEAGLLNLAFLFEQDNQQDGYHDQQGAADAAHSVGSWDFGRRRSLPAAGSTPGASTCSWWAATVATGCSCCSARPRTACCTSRPATC